MASLNDFTIKVTPALDSRVVIGQCLMMFVSGFLGAALGTMVVLRFLGH